MPRKSAAQLAAEEALAALPGGKLDRPDPPLDMLEVAAAIWRDTVASMKPRHFSRETWPLLTRYCNAMALCNLLEVELTRVSIQAPEHGEILKKVNCAAALALTYARALRLTPKSNVETRGNTRDPHRLMGPRQWGPDYQPGATLRRLWGKDDETKPS
jgi:hypothetical protein